MAVKTAFSKEELINILSSYDLGDYVDSEPLTKGAVQTNFLLQTTKGRFVFRYYENRPRESVLFECDVIQYLGKHRYLCAGVISNIRYEFVGVYRGKPYMLFEFVDGHNIENPDTAQRDQLVQKAAELHNITEGYQPIHLENRWNYGVELCRELAAKEAAKLKTVTAQEKLKWHEGELSRLELPEALRKGICHCDFHFSNVLFLDNEFKALLDFDDANYTFLTFDLVGLIESFAWSYGEWFDLDKARDVIQIYTRYRALTTVEQRHLFDVYKLSILIDCVWYFARGDANDFYEKQKIDYLNGFGREGFCQQLFG